MSGLALIFALPPTCCTGVTSAINVPASAVHVCALSLPKESKLAQNTMTKIKVL